MGVLKALQNGWKISNEGVILSLSKGTYRLTFDQVFKTQSGQVSGVTMVPVYPSDMASVLLKQGREVEYTVLHKTLGHISDESYDGNNL